MPSDDDLLDRLYGEPARERRPMWGVGGLVYAGLLIAMIVGGAGVAVLSLVAITMGVDVNEQLHTLGVLPPDEVAIAIHTERDDGQSGCALTPTAVVRWDDGRATARVPLLDGKVGVEDGSVTLRNGERTVACPFADGGAEGFAVLVDRERKKLERARPFGHLPPGAVVDEPPAGDKGAGGTPP